MFTRNRIKFIRVLAMIENDPEYAKSIGITAKMQEETINEEENQTDDHGRGCPGILAYSDRPSS